MRTMLAALPGPSDELDGVTVLDEASASMAPILGPGDRLIVAWKRGAPPRRGAIVACFDGRRIVAHRVLAVCEPVLTLKGDANRDVDPPVGIESWCGEVVAARRRDGRTLDLTSRRWRAVGTAVSVISAQPVGRTTRWLLTRALCHAAARWLS